MTMWHLARTIFSACAIYGLSACATTIPYPVGSMLPGSIVSVADGRIYPMEIQISSLSHPTGRMVATNPMTGEVLEGNYTAIVTTNRTSVSRPGLLGPETSGYATEVSSTAPAQATLVGNQGTVLTLRMQIQAGNPPVGIGEGEDNNGRRYTVQF